MNSPQQVIEVTQIVIQGSLLIGKKGDEQFQFDLQSTALRLGYQESLEQFTLEPIDQFSAHLNRVHTLPLDLTGNTPLDTYQFQVQEKPGLGPVMIGIGTVVIEDIGTDPILGEVQYIFKLSQDQQIELSHSAEPLPAFLIRYEHSKAASAYSLKLKHKPK